jgi:electron transfer flavoprotein beta subunit
MGVGTDCSQVGQMLAVLLGIPHVANVTKLEVGDASLTAGRDVEGGQELVECPLPALVTCQKGLNEPRYAALKGIMAAKRKPVDKIEVASLGIDEVSGGFYHVRSLELPPPKSEGTIIRGEDDPAAAAAQLVNLLRSEAKAI